MRQTVVYWDPLHALSVIGLQNYTIARRELELPEPVLSPMLQFPHMPHDGLPTMEFIKEFVGGFVGAMTEYLRLSRLATEYQYPAQMMRIKRVPSSVDAHRLLHWCVDSAQHEQLRHALGKAFLQDGRDMTDHEVLADIAAQTGMNRARALVRLRSDEDIDWVYAQHAKGEARGVRALPLVVLPDREAIEGIQSVDFWRERLRHIG